jgi:hypothetical protein
MHLRFAWILLAIPALLQAQAAVETAVGAGAAATTAAPAQQIGKSIAAAFDSLNRAIQSSVGSGAARSNAPETPGTRARISSRASRSSVPARPEFAVPSPGEEARFEDPSAITEGMESAELTRRFGPPVLIVTSGPGQERFSYARNSAAFDVALRDGKVAAVRKVGGPASPGAITIQ